MSNALVNLQSTPLTKESIKAYICDTATDQELVMFLELCRKRNLNPFLKQAYLIKYGTMKASMVVAKDVFIDRANRIEGYRGFRAGVILVSPIGEIVRTEGMVYPEHVIIGGWATVHRGSREPFTVEVNISEYQAKKTSGEVNGQWASKPATMIRKVALVQAHREAFPEEFSGMYDESELPAMQREEVQAKDKIEQPKKKEDIASTYGCSSCGVVILKDVHSYSMAKHGTPLCRACQKTPPKPSIDQVVTMMDEEFSS